MTESKNIFAAFHDIIVPDPVSMLPSSPGYIVLALLVPAALFPIGLHLYKYHMRNLYRKDALAELSALRSLSSLDEQLLSALQLLKKAAIVAYDRKQVASLSGSDWWTFLHDKSGHSLDPELQSYCAAVSFENSETDSERNSRVLTYIFKWIKKHKGVQID